MTSEISWKELEEKVGKIEPGQILELNLLRKGLLIPYRVFLYDR